MKLEDAIQEIKRRTDLAQVIGQTVKLTRHGSHYVGLCPFHSEKSPSFNVTPSKGFFKCFGCGAGGDVFTFLEKTTGQLFMDIVKRLAADLNIEIDQSFKPRVAPKVFEQIAGSQAAYKRGLTDASWAYLTKERKYTPELIERMGLGFGGDQPGLFQGRITIPIKDHRGQVVGFGGRWLGECPPGKPKYVNSQASEAYDKSRILYGLFDSLPLIKKQDRVVLVEGYFDVMALLAVGVPAVAPCGTSLTESHVELIQKYTQKVVLCFDQDAAGQKAHEKALMLFLSHGFQVQTVQLAEKDPDSLWQQGRQRELEALFEKPADAIEARIHKALADSVGGVQQRIAALQALLPFLSAHPNPLVNRQYVRLAAKLLTEDEAILMQAVAKAKPGSVARPIASESVVAEQVRWTDAEKLLLKSMVAYPDLLKSWPEILQMPLNQELSAFALELASKGSVLEVPVARDSVLIKLLMPLLASPTPIDRAEANEIFEGFVGQFEKQKRQNWLQQQQNRLQEATRQGDLDAVKEVLKEQSGALKKGWG